MWVCWRRRDARQRKRSKESVKEDIGEGRWGDNSRVGVEEAWEGVRFLAFI